MLWECYALTWVHFGTISPPLTEGVPSMFLPCCVPVQCIWSICFGLCIVSSHSHPPLPSFFKLGKSVKNKFLFTMTAYPGQRRPIARSPMGLPIMAGCDSAWNRTRVCSDASSTELQCLRPLLHSGALPTAGVPSPSPLSLALALIWTAKTRVTNSDEIQHSLLYRSMRFDDRG